MIVISVVNLDDLYTVETAAVNMVEQVLRSVWGSYLKAIVIYI